MGTLTEVSPYTEISRIFFSSITKHLFTSWIADKLRLWQHKIIKYAVPHDEIAFKLPLFPQMFYSIIVAFLAIPLHQSQRHYVYTSMECPILTAELKQTKLALRAHNLNKYVVYNCWLP
jgi:hypothetical protein